MAQSRELTVAFAGSGWVAAVHRYAIDQLPDVRVVAVASRDPAAAAEPAGRLGARACRYDELPAGADAVIVCTPPAHHTTPALTAIAGGAAVLLEKPLCPTLAEADALVAAVERGAVVAYAENLLHAPVVARALEHAAQLGPLDLLDVRALQSRPTWGGFLTREWGGGVLFDLGVHPLAVALVLAAPARPVEVRAVLEGAPDHPVDEHAEVHVAFDTGLVSRVTASWRGGDVPTWDAQASSPDGVVRLELLPDLLLERNGVTVPLPPTPAGPAPQLHDLGYLAQLQSFVTDVANGEQPSIGPAFGRGVLDVVCGAYHSAGLGGAWVELPFDGPRDLTPLQLWHGP